MRERPTDWLDDTPDQAPGSRRRSGLLLVAACVPWVVVVTLLVLPGRLGGVNGASPSTAGASLDAGEDHPPSNQSDPAVPGRTTTTDDPGRSPDAAGEQLASDDPSPGPPTTSEPPLGLVEHRGRWRAEAGPEEAAALAVAIARAWLTDLGPPLAVDGVPAAAEGRYAEHLVVEAVEQPGPEAAVVTVLAVVLEGNDDLHARVRRVAVPIAWEHDTPRPAGPPWWLPGPSLEPLVPATDPLEDPGEHLAVLEALAAAGLEDAQVHRLGATSGWPVVAEVTATTGSGDRITGPVWLRRHLDGYVVAGTTAASAGTDDGGGREPDP